jgi:hypothetical protein
MWKSLLMTIVVLVPVSAPVAAADRAPDIADLIANLQATDPSSSIQRLYEECNGTKVEQLYCTGYISATMESMMTIGADESARTSARNFGICPKVAVSGNASVQVFKNWAQKHPETWGLFRYLGVAVALRETWPCQ